jgi:galactose mutarotase-like enzyme
MSDYPFSIENDILKVKIKSAGAELFSLYSKQTQMEYLWQAGEAWPKHAPVLFPIVGQLKNNAYFYEGKSFSLDRHGFARNKTFKITEQDPYHIAFDLSDNHETQSVYPFPFLLTVKYEINKNNLVITYLVKNTGSRTMLFSIGAHPAFKIPLVNGEKYDDYYLLFEKDEMPEQYLLQNGLTSQSKKKIHLDQQMLFLTKSLFNNDALVIKNLKSELITIKSKHANHGLHFTFRGYPYFGIWAAKDADFICLEPWHGIADHIDHNQELDKKEGIISLLPEKTFTCSYQMTPF